MSRFHVRGFTLVELLVVITIILMVSVVVLPTMSPALSSAASSTEQLCSRVPWSEPAMQRSRPMLRPGFACCWTRRYPRSLPLARSTPRIPWPQPLGPTSIPPVYTEGTVNTFPGAMPANMTGTVTGNFPIRRP